MLLVSEYRFVGRVCFTSHCCVHLLPLQCAVIPVDAEGVCRDKSFMGEVHTSLALMVRDTQIVVQYLKP